MSEQKLKDSGATTFRPIAPEDEAFLLELFSSTRQDEMAVVAWTEEQKEAFLRMQYAAQRIHYFKQYPDAAFLIILHDGLAVGRSYVDRQEQKIHIIDLTILPQYRNRGLGTSIIKELMAEAESSGKPVTIWVEDFNPSLRLFERLGFSGIEQNGFNLKLQWRAVTKDESPDGGRG